VAHRSWGLIYRVRYEIGSAQYSLGVQSFYVTEHSIAKCVLCDKGVLIATEASYVKDKTSDEVIRFARNGGTVVTLPQSFAPTNTTTGMIPPGRSLRKAVSSTARKSGAEFGNGCVIRIDWFERPTQIAKKHVGTFAAVFSTVL